MVDINELKQLPPEKRKKVLEGLLKKQREELKKAGKLIQEAESEESEIVELEHLLESKDDKKKKDLNPQNKLLFSKT